MTSPALLRTRWAAVGAAVAITLGAAGIGGLNIASAGISEGDRPVFVPISPCRLIDTRTDAPIGASETVTIAAHGSNGACTGASEIPADAVALALNVTATNATAATFLSFWGDGSNPGTSNLNPRPGAAPTPNSVNTPLSTAGNFNIYNDAGDVNVIADVNGYYAPHDHDDRYFTEAESDERFERRQTEQQLVIDGRAWSPSSASGAWSFSGVWDHAGGAGSNCLSADVDLPADADISNATLHYRTDTAISMGDMNVVLMEFPSGPESAADPVQANIIQYVGGLAATPSGTIGSQNLSLNPAQSVTRFGYSQTIEICTNRTLAIGAVRIDYSTP